MATTLMPLDPAASPQQATRLLTISARLLPAEIIAGRRARKTRTVVIALLVVVVVLLGTWYAYAAYQRNVAQTQLDNYTADAQLLTQRQNQFADVVNVQNDTTELAKQLNLLLTRDLPWASLIDLLRTTGTATGVKVGDIDGELTAKNAGAPAAGTLPSKATGKTVGTLVVTGTADNKTQLAKYVDALDKLDVVANPYLTSAVEDKGEVQFSLQVDITNTALGGRFTTKSTGGK